MKAADGRPLLTRSGDWTFAKTFYAFEALELTPRELVILWCLWLRAVQGRPRASQAQSLDRPLEALLEREVEITHLGLVRLSGLPRTSVQRIMRRLESRGLVLEVSRGRRGRGPGNLMRLMLAHPDQVAELAQVKKRWMGIWISALTVEDQKGNVLRSKPEWARAGTNLGIFAKRLNAWISALKTRKTAVAGHLSGQLESILREVLLLERRWIAWSGALRAPASSPARPPTGRLEPEQLVLAASPTSSRALELHRTRLPDVRVAFRAAFTTAREREEYFTLRLEDLRFMPDAEYERPARWAGRWPAPFHERVKLRLEPRSRVNRDLLMALWCAETEGKKPIKGGGEPGLEALPALEADVEGPLPG